MRAPSPALVMSDAQREILESLAKSQTAAHREVTRAKALLLAADGLASTAVAYEVGVSPSSVVAWRSRFAEEGLAKLGRVRPGRGRKPQIPAEKIDEIVRLTQESKPEGETHWSCRSMAKAAVTDLSQRSRAQIRVQVKKCRREDERPTRRVHLDGYGRKAGERCGPAPLRVCQAGGGVRIARAPSACHRRATARADARARTVPDRRRAAIGGPL